jgi:Arc/MetJ-type ribon-helix-helix transcriptional regulator
MHMRNVHIQLTDEQFEGLEREAAAGTQSTAALVREAVDRWLAARERQARIDRALASIGGFDSGIGDVAENHDRYL